MITGALYQVFITQIESGGVLMELSRGAVRIPATLSIRSGRGDHTTSHEFKTVKKTLNSTFFEVSTEIHN